MENALFKARRWVVEACHSWFNRFRKLTIRCEKLDSTHLALTHLAAAIIALRKVKNKNYLWISPKGAKTNRTQPPRWSTRALWAKFSDQGGNSATRHAEDTEPLFSAQMFVFFLPRLAVDTQTRYGPRLQALDADVFPAIFANAVSAVVNALKGRLDFADQATFPVTDAQRKRPVGFSCSPVCRIGENLITVRHVFQCGIALLLRLLKHFAQKSVKVFKIAMVHACSQYWKITFRLSK
jgi:hypothetical protein